MCTMQTLEVGNNPSLAFARTTCTDIALAMTGLPIQVLNELELTLVFMLDFDMQVNPEEFAVYRDSLRRGKTSNSL